MCLFGQGLSELLDVFDWLKEKDGSRLGVPTRWSGITEMGVRLESMARSNFSGFFWSGSKNYSHLHIDEKEHTLNFK
jgi:hypothetical protein